MLHLLLIAAFESEFIIVSRYKKICLLALFTVSELLLSGDRFEIPNLGYSAVFVGVHMPSHLCFCVFLFRWFLFQSVWFCMCLPLVFRNLFVALYVLAVHGKASQYHCACRCKGHCV